MVLSGENINKLKHIPETGIGYHVVNIHLKDGTLLKNVTVLNSRILQIDTKPNFDNSDIASIEEVDLTLRSE